MQKNNNYIENHNGSCACPHCEKAAVVVEVNEYCIVAKEVLTDLYCKPCALENKVKTCPTCKKWFDLTEVDSDYVQELVTDPTTLECWDCDNKGKKHYQQELHELCNFYGDDNEEHKLTARDLF